MGVVRTGIPRSRQAGDHARTDGARRRGDRDHDLLRLQLVEDSVQVVCRRRAEHAQAVFVLHSELTGVVVDEPDGPQAELRIARQLAHDQATAVTAADDQHIAGALGDPEAPDPALRDEVYAEARADQQHQRQQEEQRDHARRQRHGRARHPWRRRRLDGMQQRDCPDDDHGGADDRLDDRLVVPLADEGPEPLIGPERGQCDQRQGYDPRDRGFEQTGVAARLAREAVEPETKSQVVAERDQRAVHEQLRKRVSVNGEGRGSHPRAHAGEIVGEGLVSVRLGARAAGR